MRHRLSGERIVALEGQDADVIGERPIGGAKGEHQQRADTVFGEHAERSELARGALGPGPAERRPRFDKE